jgi:hypothetical protein
MVILCVRYPGEMGMSVSDIVEVAANHHDIYYYDPV